MGLVKKKGEVERKNREKTVGGRNKKKINFWKGEVLGLVRWRRKSECEKEREKKEGERKA